MMFLPPGGVNAYICFSRQCLRDGFGFRESVLERASGTVVLREVS
jgi:hypothetical protein